MANLGNTCCARCGKRLGYNATMAGKTLCKKHRAWALAEHIVAPGDMGSVESIVDLDENFVVVRYKNGGVPPDGVEVTTDAPGSAWLDA